MGRTVKTVRSIFQPFGGRGGDGCQSAALFLHFLNRGKKDSDFPAFVMDLLLLPWKAVLL